MLARTAPAIAAYLVLRVLFDLCGTEQPLWWGVPLLLSGAAVAAAGSLRSAQADTLHEVVSASALLPLGMSMIAIGVALFARAVDLPSVASNALAAAWLALVAGVLGRISAVGGCRRGGTECRDAPARSAGRGHPPDAGNCGMLPRRAVGARRAAARARLCRVLAAVPVAARHCAHPRPGTARARSRRRGRGCRVGGSRAAVCRAAVRHRVPRPPAHAARGGRRGDASTGPVRACGPGGTYRCPWPFARSGAVAGGRMDARSRVAGAAGPAHGRGDAGLFAHRNRRAAGGTCSRHRACIRHRRQSRREPVWNGGFAAPPSWLPFGDPATQFGPASFSRPLQALRCPALRIDAPDRLRRWRDAALHRVAAWMAP